MTNEKKYKNKYRIASARLQSWDYGKNGAYFVTICTKDRVFYFGNVACGIMKLSQTGQLAKKYWMEIPNHFPFVKLGKFVIMPNHVHGIIIIDKSNHEMDRTPNVVETPKLGVSTMGSTTAIKTKGGKNDKWKPNTLGTIINQYKRICTINARKTNTKFAWQSRFHDHIIRSEKSFNEITEYVKTNSQKWKNDKFYAEDNRGRDAQIGRLYHCYSKGI